MTDRKRRVPLMLVAVCCLTFAALSAEAAVVTRGPYLQTGTPTSVVVRWRTDVATNSRVSYGSAPGSLTTQVNNSTATTNHQITVSGLSPDKVYYYAVGTSTGILAGNDASHFFLTAPVRGTRKAMRIWVLGDSGTANSSARAVRDAYYTFTGTRHTNLWLMLGDNAYPDGTDTDYQAAVFNTYPEMLRKSVLWPTLGNHDGHSADSASQSGPYYDIFTLPRNAEAGGVPSGTEAYYSFDYGNVHFIVLDSFDSDRSPGGAMLTWLRQDLQATSQDWIIAYWHHPPYSKGSHDSDTETALKQMRQNALPILEDGGVDLVLSGHSHSYERSFLLDSHYGTSDTLSQGMIVDGGDGRPTGDGAYQKATLGPAAHEGAVYAVAGSSGSTSGGSLDHPAMFISLSVLGSLVLDVQGSRLDATFLDSKRAVRDTFTILKAAQQPGITVNPTSGLLTTEAGGTASFTVVLDSIPTANVTIGLSSSDTTEGTVSPSSLTFTPANAGTPQTVTIRGVNDTVADGDVAYTVVTAPAVSGDSAYSGRNAADVSVRNADDEAAGSGVFEKRVAAGSDDAEQNVSTGGVSLTSSDLELVQDAGANQAVGMRFTGVTIPKGASIVNAWVQFTVDETGSSTTSVSIQGQAVDNAATFTTSASNVTSRPRTVASVNWAPGAWTAVGDAGAAQRTPNLASVIREIVSRAGWASGNSLALIITGTGTRTAESFEGSQAGAPLLHVEYGGNQPPSVSAGTDQTITLPASANLNGTVSDDGKPGPLTTTWSKLSGPGTVTFGNASAVDTTASFSAAGSYTLRLTANDGAVSVFDDVAITVNAAGQGTLSVVKKGVIHDATDATAYSFASMTASNNRLYVVFVNTSIGTGTAPSATSISGAGLTFTELGTAGGAIYSSSSGVRRVQAWRALVSAGATTGAIRISLSGTSTGMDAVLLEFGGVNTSGTNGAGAIAQNAFRTAPGATSLSIALSPLASPSNRPVAFFTHRAAEATTQATGYTELDDASHSSPVTGVECQWHASSANNAPSASWSTAADGAGVALEIKATP